MAIAPRDCVDALHAQAQNIVEPASGWPAGAPSREFTRSPAAATIGRLAAQAELFLFHFEHRAHLALPDAWVPDPELAVAPEWTDGVLPERKYQSFRHDLPIGSFHPGHRAKWATHELCHALVGFAWRPDATPFFHATAGRLAELLPVTLWYFFDEVHLRRCPVHQGGGALFRTLCPLCEAEASTLREDPEALRVLEDAFRFVDRELAAVARSRRMGLPISHQWATIDLCSDGVAYAASHGDRLTSEAFRVFADLFLVEAAGAWSTLDALEARVLQVGRALLGQGDPPPLAGDRSLWVAQDLGWRLLTTWADTGVQAVADLAEELAASRDVLATRTAYEELRQEHGLPSTEAVFAVGYDIEGGGRDAVQIAEGLRSVVPRTMELVDDADLHGLIEQFVAEDVPRRVNLGRRFAEWLPGPPGDLATFEVALRTASYDAQSAALGEGEGWRLASGIEVLHLDVPVVEVAAQVETGAFQGVAVDGVLTIEGIEAEETLLLVGREASGEPVVLDVPVEAAPELLEGRVPAELVEELVELGALVPQRFVETA